MTAESTNHSLQIQVNYKLLIYIIKSLLSDYEPSF